MIIYAFPHTLSIDAVIHSSDPLYVLMENFRYFSLLPGSFPGVKRPGREAGHSPHLVPRSKNEWSYTSIPQYAFLAWCSVKKKHRDKFTFTFTQESKYD
jgi:hypothetical protein